MKLTKGEESTLLVAFTEALKDAVITEYGYVRLPENWEKNTKATFEADFEKRLYEKLDDGGLESLLQNYILREFYRNGYALPSGEGDASPIVDFPIFKDYLSSSKNIVDCVKSLPLSYNIIMRGLNSLGERNLPTGQILEITDRLHIVRGDDLLGNFKTSTGVGKLDQYSTSYNVDGGKFRQIDENALYFSYMTSGLISDRSSSKFINSFHDDVKSFYGAALAYDLYYAMSNPFLKEPTASIANLIIGKSREFVYCGAIENDLAEAFSYYHRAPEREGFAAGETGPLKKFFKPVIDLFNCEESQRLKTAAIWIFRSHTNQRWMDKILDATIAIEVLLGDREASDRVGLSKLMANRCAYSLGRSHSERSQLNDFFINFYKVRSDIVHSGRLGITKAEKQVVTRGISLAARLLRNEASMSSPASR